MVDKKNISYLVSTTAIDFAFDIELEFYEGEDAYFLESYDKKIMRKVLSGNPNITLKDMVYAATLIGYKLKIDLIKKKEK